MQTIRGGVGKMDDHGSLVYRGKSEVCDQGYESMRRHSRLGKSPKDIANYSAEREYWNIGCGESQVL